jgi:uridine phosphorylase
MPDDAIIRPAGNMPGSRIGPFAVMAGNSGDLHRLCRLFGLEGGRTTRLLMSRFHFSEKEVSGVPCLAGPFIGAPYAAILLENLVSSGAREILFLGWCGSISPDVKIGDIVIPDGAYIDEGTSLHYGGRSGEKVGASIRLLEKTREVLAESGVPFHSGPVWTTDALYRETARAVAAYREKGGLAVEMECSALFSIAKFRKIDISGLLVVSDALTGGAWNPGFRQDVFQEGRKTACRMIERLFQAHGLGGERHGR